MEKNIDVMKRVLELSETMLEGLEYVKDKVNGGEFEWTIRLVNDILNAFGSIESRIIPLLGEIESHGIEERTTVLRNAFDSLVTSYEQGNAGKTLEILHFTVIPAIKKWKLELEEGLNPYVNS